MGHHRTSSVWRVQIVAVYLRYLLPHHRTYRETPWPLFEATEPQKDGCGSALTLMRSYFIASILPGMTFFGSIASSTVVAWINTLRVAGLT